MNTNILAAIAQSLFAQFPVLVVALVACIVTILNWEQSPSASLFSLLGFGLTLFLCFAIPIGQSVATSMLVPNDGSVANTRFVFTGLAIFWSLLRAAAYVLLLSAIYTGRTATRPASTPPPVS